MLFFLLLSDLVLVRFLAAAFGIIDRTPLMGRDLNELF